MSNHAIELIEKRLEYLNESVSRARTYLKVEEKSLAGTREAFAKLEQEQSDLRIALEELAQAQQEGLVRS